MGTSRYPPNNLRHKDRFSAVDSTTPSPHLPGGSQRILVDLVQLKALGRAGVETASFCLSPYLFLSISYVVAMEARSEKMIQSFKRPMSCRKSGFSETELPLRH